MKINFQYSFSKIILLLVMLSSIELQAEIKGTKKFSITRNELAGQLKTGLKGDEYSHLRRIIGTNFPESITLDDLKKIERVPGSEKVLQAIEATKALYQSQTILLGVKRADSKIALFIETGLKEYINRRQFFIPKDQTLLACSIEYDPQTGASFIHLPENKNTYIGAGKNKVVLKAIHYNGIQSAVVARALQTNVREAEMKTTTLVKGLPGIMDILGCTEYVDENMTYRTIYTKLYTGSLSQALDRNYNFTIHEKMKIALNILKGLHELHQRNIVHRDISPQNFLINVPAGKPGKRNIEAVVADLGRASSIWEPAPPKKRVQGHSIYTPPDGILLGKIKGHDKVLCDVYATGCVFYRLFYGKAAPWLNQKYITGTVKTEKKRYRGYVSRINQYTSPRTKVLGRKNSTGPLTPTEEFEMLILKMCDPDPGKRGTSIQLYTNLLHIIARYEAQNKTR